MLESAKFVKTKNSSGEDEGQCFDEMRALGAVVASVKTVIRVQHNEFLHKNTWPWLHKLYAPEQPFLSAIPQSSLPINVKIVALLFGSTENDIASKGYDKVIAGFV